MRAEQIPSNDEIKRIKSEIRFLKKELRIKRKNQKRRSGKYTSGENTFSDNEVFRSKSDILTIYRGSSYIKTLYAVVKNSAFYELFTRSLTLFRGFRIMTYVAGVIGYIIALIGTGALLLVYVSFLAVILLIFFIILLNTVILAGAERKRANLYFERLCEFEKIYIFFTHRSQKYDQNSFFSLYISELADNSEIAILVVTSHLISVKTFDGSTGKGYLTFRRERKNVYMLRQHYYFSFKKEILPKIKDKTILIF